MSTRTTPWPPGMPCWADLSAPDPDAAKAFYAAVLGWDYSEAGDEYGGYVTALVGGSAVAGIGPQQQPGPVAWTLYLASMEVDATAGLIDANGGAVFLEPVDVGDLGRMALATDPSGAVFGVWQAGSHIGAGRVNEPGGLAWDDLRSTDPEKAWAFYEAVFGYETHALDAAGPTYRTFHFRGDEAPLGGMGGMMGGGDRSHWLVYFSVASADEAVAAVEAAGGTVQAPAFDTPYGRMAAVADPFGAAFMLTQNTTGQPQPDRGN
jgi:predicted enzyme related to lactoylglutathione lyase